jgi:hypothetical protein
MASPRLIMPLMDKLAAHAATVDPSPGAPLAQGTGAEKLKGA